MEQADQKRLERKQFLITLAAKSGKELVELGKGDTFQGKVSSKPIKHDGKSYVVVENRKQLTVLRASESLRKSVGKEVSVKLQKKPDGRVSHLVTPIKSRGFER